MTDKNVLQMTADSIGKDLLSALVTEMKLMPDIWVKLSEKKQNDVIDRLRARVEHNVKMATHLIASDGRIVVQGDLDQITIKDGVKAVVKFGGSQPNLHELYEASGKPFWSSSPTRASTPAAWTRSAANRISAVSTSAESTPTATATAWTVTNQTATSSTPSSARCRSSATARRKRRSTSSTRPAGRRLPKANPKANAP
ncbi:hypothetical protein ABEG10_08460 [Burkholderia cenocepacia]|uniref:hypothetical protein n=1 Tax=Burkholderia cenocepacia TaxID=95486 RepID=UPI0020A010B7|nr:hypothetical protein [Burkholderia cenocepacia]